jgi:hypothetical protein
LVIQTQPEGPLPFGVESKPLVVAEQGGSVSQEVMLAELVLSSTKYGRLK